MDLVQYASDSEAEDVKPSIGQERSDSLPSDPRNSTKSLKRKGLPSLPGDFVAAPLDDPTLHQGRRRTRPFVDGDFDTHVYINLTVPRRLHDVLQGLIQRTGELCPGLEIHSLLRKPGSGPEGESEETRLPLHISMTHSFPLRRSQIKSFHDELAENVGSKCSRFRISLAGSVKIYYNASETGGVGSGGRAFMALRVGAGSNELNDVIDRVIHPMLDKLHLPRYHSNPEYHASFAWCLTRPQRGMSTLTATATAGADDVEDTTIDAPSQGMNDFPNSNPISDSVLSSINRDFETSIASLQPRNGWLVETIEVKSGKEIRRIPLD